MTIIYVCLYIDDEDNDDDDGNGGYCVSILMFLLKTILHLTFIRNEFLFQLITNKARQLNSLILFQQ